jgi:ATP-dependent exoDNAse (exonuclease V) beta subunit
VLVGVPDAALVPLWGRDFPGKMLALHAPDPARLEALRVIVRDTAGSLPEGVPGLERVAGWEHNLVAAVEAVAALRESAHRDPADVFVERLRVALLAEATESARYQGPWRGANLDRFFRALLQDLDEGGDFHRVLRRLRSAVAESLDAEEGRPREVLEDAVQIMTIHGAKGLDFDHVYLMQCHKASGNTRGARVDSGHVEGRLEYSVLGAPTPGWYRVLSGRAIREQAEDVRTLYVALTRARDRLVISGLWPSLESRNGSGRPTDLLVERAAGVPDLEEELARVASDEGTAWVDAVEARWVFPSVETEAVPSGDDGASTAARLPTVDAIARASRTLLAHREAASERMRRPLAGAATLDADENADEAADGRLGEGPPGVPAWHRGGDDGVARAVGTAVHRALEHFDFLGDLDDQLAAAEVQLRHSIEGELALALRGRALTRAGEMLRQVATGPLMARFRALADRIIARELPVLVRPSSQQGPVGCVTGAIDLVYRDPGTERLVIADYKTGARHDYSVQGDHYRRALREGLGLDYEPRFELWYLEEGAIVDG